ncbi:MAG TPA: thioredoxin-disulfide reductase [bacterium]|nr:thioredoxin-disulfide reductase [bacterium]
MEKEIYIIGAGPAGITAGIYALRSKIKTTIIEKFSPGGNMLITETIENYPGFPDGINGLELAERMKKQFLNLGGEIITKEVVDIDFKKDRKTIFLSDGKFIDTDVFIIATGSSRKKLGVKGEDVFIGKGVSYCAVCDGFFFKNKNIAVIGGGDSALKEAIYLTRFVNRCYLVHRREQFRGSKYLQELIENNEKISPIVPFVVEEIIGKEKVEYLLLRNTKTDEKMELKVDGIFISVGQKPNVEFLKGKLKSNPSGYLIVNEKMETSTKGVFACGDVIKKDLYQIITACGEGAIAAFFAEKYLDSLD